MSPIISKKDTYYRFRPDGKYRRSVLKCDTPEEFQRALISLKESGSLPDSMDINNIMSLVRDHNNKSDEWEIVLDEIRRNKRSLSPEVIGAIIGACAVILAALIGALL